MTILIDNYLSVLFSVSINSQLVYGIYFKKKKNKSE